MDFFDFLFLPYNTIQGFYGVFAVEVRPNCQVKSSKSFQDKTKGSKQKENIIILVIILMSTYLLNIISKRK